MIESDLLHAEAERLHLRATAFTEVAALQEAIREAEKWLRGEQPKEARGVLRPYEALLRLLVEQLGRGSLDQEVGVVAHKAIQSLVDLVQIEEGGFVTDFAGVGEKRVGEVYSQAVPERGEACEKPC